MAVLENVFTWSKSRDEQFRECQRKYYYDKYASWGGWDAQAPKPARLAYIYKNLKNRWAWKGETVHHVIENILKALRAGPPADMKAVLETLTQRMREEYKASKAKKYFNEPKKSLGLFEHEYEKEITDDVWKKIHDESADCVRNFLNSSFYKELLTDDKKSWLLIEDLEEFNFEGCKVYVKLDFCRKNGQIVEIYDWKTGKSNGEGFELQMGAYALYAMDKWKIPLSRIRAFIFNLTGAQAAPQEQVLTEALLEESRKLMRASIEEMRKLLQDVARNEPKPAAEFLFTDNARLCGTCNFYKICEKYA